MGWETVVSSMARASSVGARAREKEEGEGSSRSQPAEDDGQGGRGRCRSTSCPGADPTVPRTLDAHECGHTQYTNHADHNKR